MADFTPIPQFLVGWTLALLVFVFCSFWEETLGAFILLAYFNLSVAAACCLIAVHPALFLGVTNSTLRQ
ncbi:hypothetical protein Daesc_007877 [Daldinia eschscholtzii]|uniref:Uncharacterized protein n=1 Tax=Daldinia eschscholtzii TaxID=292717 RepID=A0AAX6MFW7_9PEZI